MERHVRPRLAGMGIITGASETVLGCLGSCEFNFTKAATPDYARNVYLRYMNVERGKLFWSV